MLRKFLKSRSIAPGAIGSVPPGTRVYAIGDVHGCDDLLERLVATIDADDAERDDAETTLVFLGDLVDRGPSSAAVVERVRLLAETRPRVRVLMGNHEETFVRAIAGEEKALRLFSRIGGRETMLSYGIDADTYERLDYTELADMLRRVVPPEHVAFLSCLEDMVLVGDYAFVHAGVRPGVLLAEQQQQDLRWIREAFLDHRKLHEKTIVHGHTITGTPELLRNRIGIDTGAYAGGPLTALGLEGDKRWILNTETSNA